MKKSDLATLTYGTQRLLQINDTMSVFLVETIKSSISLLATAEPKMAISVINQLSSQIPEIQQFIKQVDTQEVVSVAELAKSLPDYLDLTDKEDYTDSTSTNSKVVNLSKSKKPRGH